VAIERVPSTKVAAVSRDWIRYQRTHEARYAWAEDEATRWQASDDFDVIRRLVMAMVAAVALDEKYVVAMIGAGPLEDLVETDPEAALRFVEAEVERSAVLREALANVWSRQKPSVRARIDGILARYGQRGAPN
jgi:uncharacterized protein DUF6869